MKPYELRALAYTRNKTKLGIKDIDEIITTAAKDGNFSANIPLQENWGNVQELRDHYKALGFYTHLDDHQVSPNSSEKTLYLSWEE